MRRRTYLMAATGTSLALAGCAAVSEDDEPDEAENRTDESDDVDEHDDHEDEADSADDEPPELAGTFDDFESLEEWEVLAGTATGDTDRSFVGSQSVHLEPDDDGEDLDEEDLDDDELEDEDDGVQVRLRRELDESLDCSAVAPGLAVALEGEPVTAPLIQLFDGDGNRIDYRTSADPTLEFHRHNFGVAAVDSAFDFGDVTEIQLAYITGAGTAGELWIDDLYFVPRPETGKVLVQLDGGYETHYTHAASIVDEHDLSATTFVAPGRVRGDEDEDGDRLTEAQLESLAEAGWTIGSHTDTDTQLPDAEDLEAEVRDAYEWLEAEGYDGRAYFSFPGGKYNDASLDQVEEYHDHGFAGRFPAQGYAANPLLWQRVVDPDPDEARDALERTAEVGGITSLCYVRLEEESAENFEETMGDLADYVADGDLELLTPADLDEYVYEEE